MFLISTGSAFLDFDLLKISLQRGEKMNKIFSFPIYRVFWLS